MQIAGLQKLTLLDFPGRIACTVFLPGCNLRCPFCHNASLVLPQQDSPPPMTADELLAFLQKRRGRLQGVCITGGEPTLHPDLPDLLRQIHLLGFEVKLDTNGSDPDALASLLSEGGIDYIAMDIKSAPESYEKAVGRECDLKRFVRSSEIIRTSGIPHEFRTTLVKGIHELGDMEGIGKWLAGEERYFLQTFVDSGNLLGSGFEAFSHEETMGFLKAIRIYIPSAKLRGQEEGE